MEAGPEEAPPTPSEGDVTDQDIDVSQEAPVVPEEPEPVSPEELELCKLAIRALNFNSDSKELHNMKLSYKGDVIPFEQIPTEFEKHKMVLPILFYVESLMDRFEGEVSKWTEDPSVKGKSIVDKIKAFNAVAKGDEKLDKAKRIYWVRIILNCLIHGTPAENLVVTDVTPESLPEIFSLLKQKYGMDSRALISNSAVSDNSRAPGVF